MMTKMMRMIATKDDLETLAGLIKVETIVKVVILIMKNQWKKRHTVIEKMEIAEVMLIIVAVPSHVGVRRRLRKAMGDHNTLRGTSMVRKMMMIEMIMKIGGAVVIAILRLNTTMRDCVVQTVILF
jgi:hypothetical protein